MRALIYKSTALKLAEWHGAVDVHTGKACCAVGCSPIAFQTGTDTDTRITEGLGIGLTGVTATQNVLRWFPYLEMDR